MNTPAHIILSAVVAGRGRLRTHWLAISIGAVLPDLPMVGFYLYQRLWMAATEEMIWTRLYFDVQWQNFFDLFNSLPLIAIGLGIAFYRKSTAALALFSSMALHVAADLLLHREDAHGHFYPLTDWRFESPVSYWDPEHFGLIVGALELVGVVVGSLIVIRRGTPWHRVGYTTLALYATVAGFAIFYWTSR